MKTIPITVSGGFHNMRDLTVRAKIRTLNTGYRVAELTETQLRKISRHMCGMSGCVCGGGYGDVWHAPEGWVKHDHTLWVDES